MNTDALDDILMMSFTTVYSEHHPLSLSCMCPHLHFDPCSSSLTAFLVGSLDVVTFSGPGKVELERVVSIGGCREACSSQLCVAPGQDDGWSGSVAGGSICCWCDKQNDRDQQCCNFKWPDGVLPTWYEHWRASLVQMSLCGTPGPSHYLLNFGNANAAFGRNRDTHFGRVAKKTKWHGFSGDGVGVPAVTCDRGVDDR